eukprot:4416034-Pleurochrysis_carterae.AAC.2
MVGEVNISVECVLPGDAIAHVCDLGGLLGTGCSSPCPNLTRGGGRLPPAYRVRRTDHPRERAATPHA